MKETKEVVQDSVQEVVKEIIKTPERKKVGFIRPSKGHSLFSYNKLTGKLEKIETKSQAKLVVNAGGRQMIKKETQVDINENCIYVTALNLQNAVKKISKYYGVDVKLIKK